MNKELQQKIEELASGFGISELDYLESIESNKRLITKLLSSPDLLRLAGLYTKEEVREAASKAWDEAIDFCQENVGYIHHHWMSNEDKDKQTYLIENYGK